MSVICGDSLLVLPTLDAESVDAIVCDPPYGLSFMGKDWDHGVPGEAFWREALRVAKPGAHLVAFGGTRTFHRLAVAIEDAGWEIRDCLSWLYGSGFPKSHDVSKAMDKAAGAERKVIGHNDAKARRAGNQYGDDGRTFSDDAYVWNKPGAFNITTPATAAACEWQGWGTALKPAWEPIILARKPLIVTVAANVTQYGTGALNVDGCRIGTDGTRRGNRAQMGYHGGNVAQEYQTGSASGRWPANVCLDEEAARMLDEQSGERKSQGGAAFDGGGCVYSKRKADTDRREIGYGDTGGASRFFYTAKASRREREAGLEAMPERVTGQWGDPFAQGRNPQTGERTGTKIRPTFNSHPTVKPIALMRWLCRLVTPKGGLILDPFAGSGTTGCAAVLEGFRFVGVEREPEYVAIAEARIAHWAAQTPDADLFTEAR